MRDRGGVDGALCVRTGGDGPTSGRDVLGPLSPHAPVLEGRWTGLLRLRIRPLTGHHSSSLDMPKLSRDIKELRLQSRSLYLLPEQGGAIPRPLRVVGLRAGRARRCGTLRPDGRRATLTTIHAYGHASRRRRSRRGRAGCLQGLAGGAVPGEPGATHRGRHRAEERRWVHMPAVVARATTCSRENGCRPEALSKPLAPARACHTPTCSQANSAHGLEIRRSCACPG